jgi:hypothetical protein
LLFGDKDVVRATEKFGVNNYAVRELRKKYSRRKPYERDAESTDFLKTIITRSALDKANTIEDFFHYTVKVKNDFMKSERALFHQGRHLPPPHEGAQ